VLGPFGDGKTPPKNKKVGAILYYAATVCYLFISQDVDYVFCGIKNLVERYNAFIETMNNQFQTHKEWKGADQESNNLYPRLSNYPVFETGFDDEMLEYCSDHLERYIMNRLAPVAFAETEVAVEDTILARRMQLLQFLKPQVSNPCHSDHMR
jgi:hypothetical protein